MLNGRRIRALRSSTSGHGSFRTRLLQRSSIVPPEAHYKAHGPRVSYTGSLFFNKIRRPPVRLGRNHVERRTRKTAVCGQRTETPPKKVGKLLNPYMASETRLAGPHNSRGGAIRHSGTLRERWRSGGPTAFSLQARKGHGAQRSGPRPWKRSFCSSGQDRDKTVSGRGPFPSLAQPGWFVSPGPLAARPTCLRRLARFVARLFPASGLFRFARPAGSTAHLPAKTGAVRRPPSSRERRPTSPAVRLRTHSPSASDPFAADAPGPPKHHVIDRK